MTKTLYMRSKLLKCLTDNTRPTSVFLMLLPQLMIHPLPLEGSLTENLVDLVERPISLLLIHFLIGEKNHKSKAGRFASVMRNTSTLFENVNHIADINSAGHRRAMPVPPNRPGHCSKNFSIQESYLCPRQAEW